MLQSQAVSNTIERGYGCRIQCFQKVENFHERAGLPLCILTEQDRHIVVIHVSLFVSLPYTVNNSDFGFIVNANVVSFIELTNFLVPKVERVHPIVAHPA